MPARGLPPLALLALAISATDAFAQTTAASPSTRVVVACPLFISFQAFAVVGVPFLARAVGLRFDVGLLRYLTWVPIALGALLRSNRAIP